MTRALMHQPPETAPVQVTKALMYTGAILLMFWPLATTVGLVSAAVAIALASFAAQRAFTRGVRPLAVVLLGGAATALFVALGGVVRDTTWIAMALGVEGTIYTSDILLLGFGLGSALFVLRYLAKRSRPIGVVEVLLIAFAVVYVFIDHRNLNLNHPRAFADFALSQGWDPTLLLKILGVAVMVLALFMLLRQPGGWRIIITLAVVGVVGWALYELLLDDKVPQAPEPPTADLMDTCEPGDEDCKPVEVEPCTDPATQNCIDLDGDGKPDAQDKDGDGKPDAKDKDGDGKPDRQGGGGGGGGGGGSKSPYSKQFQRQDPPQPVAVVTFHDDFESEDGVLYFRQNVLSGYDQTHLTSDTTGTWDKDVITTFPTTAPIAAAPTQNTATHTAVPTSMYLLADHPQPVALSHASELRPILNPNPNLFVAAYEVTSQKLSVEYQRLLGRRSVPESWDATTRQHYLAHPDDPRYEALADQIIRDLDPRYQDDDLMKAYAIKRYLEVNGFYTLKETHTSDKDPTASFLFGSMRGYCVHFAHSAVFLMRSQGIAARVAVGYGVDTKKRGSGSSMLILGNQAHAWPEIHLEGIGWVTFDVYPERSDEPPQQIVDQDLANMLGEIARNDPSGGRRPDLKSEPFDFLVLLWILLGAAGAILAAGYIVKATRRLLPLFVAQERTHRWAMLGALDRFADMGERREFGETLEGFARRMGAVAPSLAPLTMTHLRRTLGGPADRGGLASRGLPTSSGDARSLYRQTAVEVRKNVPLGRRLLGLLNPFGWFLSR